MPASFGFDLAPDEWLARVGAALRTGLDVRPTDAEDAPGDRPGARIGRYELVERLGSGGMGTVWLARQADGLVDRAVALKLIRRGMDTEDILHRFRLERQVLGTLEHPHIGRLYDAGADDTGRPFLVMEYVQGLPLREYANRNGCTIDQRLELIRKVAAAVHYAHNNLVLHRDLKPSNILVAPDGTPKLLDFGIARLLSDDGVAITSVTAADSRILTPRYASPEQIRRERLTTASDVYSLGLLLFELLTNRSPYDVDEESCADYERAILTGRMRRTTAELLATTQYRPAERRSLLSSLRGDLGTIIRKAMAPLPEDRYGSAEQFAEDVRRYLEGLPLLARRAGVLRRTMRVLRRNRRSLVVATVAALLALAAGGTALTFWFMAPGWAREHVRDAHMALLDPSYLSMSVWNVVFYGTDNWATQGKRAEVNLPAAREALAAYAAALRLEPHNERIRQETETLRLVVALATEPHPDPQTSNAFRQAAPLTTRFAADWMADGTAPRINNEEFDAATATDLRSLGMLTMLCGDIATTLRAWSRLGDVDADPLIEAMQGVLCLALDQPELAYPRLLSAYRRYPESGVLCTYLADAAVQCSDVALTERLLARGETLEGSDGFGALPRVRMLYYLATGRDDLAADVFESNRLITTNPVAMVQYARHLAEHGEIRKALALFVPQCGLRATPVLAWRKLQAFLDLSERWWAGLDDDARSEIVLSTLAGSDPRDPGSFVALLRAYHRSVPRLQNHPGIDDTAWTPTMSYVPSEAQLHARRELLVMYDRMGIEDDYRWAHIAENPPSRTSVEPLAWTSPTPPWFAGPVVEVREDGRDPLGASGDAAQPFQKLLPTSGWTEHAGAVVDVDGDHAVVCSGTEACMYHRIADGWTLEQRISSGLGLLNAALDGNRLLLTHQNSGADHWEASVWQRSAGEPPWRIVTNLALPAQDASTRLTLRNTGLSGDLAVIGMTSTSRDGSQESTITTFRRDATGGIWQWEQSLPIASGASEERGVSIAAGADLIVVGFCYSPGEHPLRVYRHDADAATWRMDAEPTWPALRDGNVVGVRSVACNGDTIVAGATAYGEGEVYAYRMDSDHHEWILEARLSELLPEPAPNFGWRVAIDGDRITAAAQDVESGYPDEWHQFLFDRQTESWTYRGVLREQDSGFDDFDDGQVALSGSTLLVGAPRHDAAGIDAGAAYVFDLP